MWNLGLLDRVKGIFALILWDATQAHLLAARDPLGIQPLFYAAVGDNLLFSSQIDQLVAQPVWAPDGSGIAYFAPGVAAGPFQLWFLPKAAYVAPPPAPPPTPTPGGPHNGPLPSPSPTPAPLPVKPIQVTTNDGFDATSPMAWAA